MGSSSPFRHPLGALNVYDIAQSLHCQQLKLTLPVLASISRDLFTTSEMEFYWKESKIKSKGQRGNFTAMCWARLLLDFCGTINLEIISSVPFPYLCQCGQCPDKQDALTFGSAVSIQIPRNELSI